MFIFNKFRYESRRLAWNVRDVSWQSSMSVERSLRCKYRHYLSIRQLLPPPQALKNLIATVYTGSMKARFS